jgi:hypothetical protein
MARVWSPRVAEVTRQGGEMPSKVEIMRMAAEMLFEKDPTQIDVAAALERGDPIRLSEFDIDVARAMSYKLNLDLREIEDTVTREWWRF